MVMPSKVSSRRNPRFIIFLFAFLSLLFLSLAYVLAPVLSKKHGASCGADPDGSHPPAAQSTQVARSAMNPALLNLPLSFEPAEQANEFFVRGAGYRLLVTPSTTTIALTHHRHERLLSATLAGANEHATVAKLDELPGRRNYLIGNDSAKWRTDVPTYSRVRFNEVYPGINVTYYGNQHQLEYDFEVAAGADPRQIQFAFSRKVRPRIAANGDLILRIEGGEIVERKPIVYQSIDGDRRFVEARFVLRGERQAAFEIGSFDGTKPLVIDPTLVYATYLGGVGDEVGSSIAVDSNNNVYITGTTSSTNFPTLGPAFANNAGLSDIFVTKINAAGSAIIYSTYIGGSGLDGGDGIAVDNSGNAYVVGRVDSSSTNFPTTNGAFATTYRGGDFDGVLFKLNAQGNALVYSTFLGGEENDSTEGIAVDANGNAYVTDGTKSQGFPTTVNAYQGTRAGDTDAFLAKLNPSGTSLLYSTYLGGSGTDRGSGVAVDSNGNAYVAGFAGSADFPTQNAFQNSFGGSFDAF